MSPLLAFAALALAQERPTAPVDVSAPPPAPTSTCPPQEIWPTGGWADGSVAAIERHPDVAAALYTHLFPPSVDLADKDRRGTRTDGIVVIHDGKLVYEAYARGYTEDKRHLAWSAAKTFTAALAGIAQRAGALDLDASICDHIEVANPDSCRVTSRNLLEFASGWDWTETYENQSPRVSSVGAMLYGMGARDNAAFVTGHSLRSDPGTTFAYSSGDTTVLAAVVGAALQPEHGERWPWTALFDPLGIESAVFEQDAAGTYVGSSSLFLTPRDMARFGYFLLNDGCWEGERILPEGWVDDSRRVVQPFLTHDRDGGSGVLPGRSMWLNTTAPETGRTDLPWPNTPPDTFAALGHWKQMILVVPSQDLVVVRTGDDRDGSFNRDHMMRLVLELIEEEG